MAVEGQPLIPTRGAAGRGAVEWEEQLRGGGGRVRLVAGAVGCVAVLALLGMETRGLMHFVDEESSGLAAGRGMRARPVSLLGKCISGDCKDGQGVYVWHTGEMYEGPFKHSRMHGRNGKYKWNDVPNNITYEYVGDFDHGDMPQGCVAGDCRGRPDVAKDEWIGPDGLTTRGVYVWPNGEEYVGEWRSGLMEGDGTYRWPDGESYEGEWREGKRYGEGINNYAPGANPSPFYDGYWNYDKVVDDYPNSIYAGH